MCNNIKRNFDQGWINQAIRDAMKELEDRRCILNNLSPGTHPDIVLAAELEVTAQEKRINGLISEAKEMEGEGKCLKEE